MPNSRLIVRLEEIGSELSGRPGALGLLALGSSGLDQERLDAYSDLDFFVLVRPGHKDHFLEDLSWLTNLAPEGFYYRNTVDGFKFLFKDDVFCEFAVFEPQELPNIPFARGKIIWSHSHLEPALLQPNPERSRVEPSRDLNWICGEILCNIYMGLNRYLRGEKLSALKLIQHHNTDRFLECLLLHFHLTPEGRDPFSLDRRFEFLCPESGALFQNFFRGYDGIVASAQAQLLWLEQQFQPSAFMCEKIRVKLDEALEHKSN